MNKKTFIYPSALIGAALMMLLRICDHADLLSVTLVTAGMTALLYSVRHASCRKEYLHLAAIISITFAVRFYGYTGGPAVDVVLGLLVGLIMFALMAVEHRAEKHKDTFWYPLIYPSAYILFMYFTEIVKINMPFRLDPYFSCIPLLCQITAVLGIYFIDFLLGWTASVLVFLMDHKTSRSSIAAVSCYAIALSAVLGFGTVHSGRMNAQEKAKSDTVRVAYVTGPYCGTFTEAGSVHFTLEETITSFANAVTEAAQDHAEILLFSEEAYCILDTEEDTLIHTAQNIAEENNMHLLLAYEVEDTDDSEDGKSINKLSWITDEGEIIYDYTKHCIIPVIETSEYVRGDKDIEAFEINVHGKTLEVASAICYDSDFDLFMSSMGKNIDLLLFPTWDWKVIAEEHFGVARLRAISMETTLVRSVYDGWSAVIDSAGNVLARDNTNEVGYETVLVYDVPIH